MLPLLVGIGFAVLVLGLLSLSLAELLNLTAATVLSWHTLALLLTIFSGMVLARIMDAGGVTEELGKRLGGGCALLMLPLLLGMIPMPGGALVSAMLLRKLSTPESSTTAFTNYWFRHLLIPVWPLYPAFILTMGVTHLTASELIAVNLPLALSALAAGLLLSWRHLRLSPARCISGVLRTPSLWLILLPLSLGVVLNIPLYAVILLSALGIALLTGAGAERVKKAARGALDAELFLLVILVLLLRDVVRVSGAGERLAAALQVSGEPLVGAALVSFTVGLLAGIEMAPAGIAVPLFISLVEDSRQALLVLFASGYLGVQLSPVHLCLTASVRYLDASLLQVYRRVFAACLLTALFLGIWLLLQYTSLAVL
ncbi:MAG: DUF401 family protein [Euryarchaeota archaeon]|nr:DUF401 family protein [Euryarchaeota archaeon]